MIYLVAWAILCQVVGVIVVLMVVKSSQKERRELEDRLMAICHPIAHIAVASERNQQDAKLTYIDEEPFSARTGADHAAV